MTEMVSDTIVENFIEIWSSIKYTKHDKDSRFKELLNIFGYPSYWEFSNHLNFLRISLTPSLFMMCHKNVTFYFKSLHLLASLESFDFVQFAILSLRRATILKFPAEYCPPKDYQSFLVLGWLLLIYLGLNVVFVAGYAKIIGFPAFISSVTSSMTYLITYF
uniref:Uncharacterized protein n=1 Tax=Vespula pensylvanica TaxID=30213 RepID=A0A834P2Y5_VESPE|nr:hypothetical protein H0235_008318 [Vespula pensylvanica]